MSGMFSLFCGPKKPSEENEDTNEIEYLESKSLTFDTLETDGTDEFVCLNPFTGMQILSRYLEHWLETSQTHC